MRCLRSLYLIWFKSHGTKCSKRPIAILAKSETLPKKLQLINGRFTTILGHFLLIVWTSFTKLRFRRSFLGAKQVLISIGSEIMTQNAKKHKNAKNTIEVFLTKLQKNENGNFCILCHNLWANLVLDLLSTSK